MPSIDFDVSQYEAPQRTSYDPLPPGEYPAIVSQTDLKDTKAGTGQYIELTIQIIDGEFSGRRIWERLNVINPSEQTVQIARAQLNQLAQACNVTALKDTDQLCDIPFKLVLDIDRKDTTRNRVMGYEPAGSASRAPAKPAPAAAAPAKKPWER
jgi:hypothetical protein